ncbi:SsrA-binding protein SmpB [Mangrovivirga cuniculi]|uniref:SsrA-binding protein n=1 Tax=Mangrovivirga cuniculi TaxID=2715131 RepID=A0A4D7JTZ4_9BACT|nr:SsrA-binding protein SmpB [Mangrovivirga cuniculi]QCK16092.1 SsrA-binding protein [Mangrovivirga cuniculi]
MSKKDKDIQNQVNIKNRKASYEYEWLEKYTAGLVLKGTEIKSIRMGKVNLQEAYCTFHKGELWVRSMHISPYEQGSFYNHEAKADRKLLLNKRELEKLKGKMEEKGLAIIPTKLFINDRGFAKLNIALAKGKKLHDKRESIKEKDMKRELQRQRF